MPQLPSPAALVEITRYAVGQVVETAASMATVPFRVLGLLGQTELLVSRMTMLAERAEGLIGRVDGVVDGIEDTLRNTKIVMAAAALAVDEATAVAARAALIVGEAGTVASRAGLIVDEAGTVASRAGLIVDEAGTVASRAGLIVDEAGTVASRAGLIVDGAAAAVTGATAIVADAGRITDAASGVVRQASATSAEANDLLAGFAPALHRAAPLAARFIEELTPEEVTAAIRMIDELPRLRRHLTEDVMPLLGKLDQVGPDLHSLLEVTNDLHLAIAGLPG